MRLAEFIISNLEAILAEWESFASSIWPEATPAEPAVLRDHAEEMLRAMAADMGACQTAAEQVNKSRGLGANGPPRAAMDLASTAHGGGRFRSGLTLPAVLAEYRALRASVIRQWRESEPSPTLHDLDDLTRFNESIDQSIIEAVTEYTKVVAQVQRNSDRLIRESEGRFRALTSATSDSIYRMSPDWSEMRQLAGRDLTPAATTPTRGWLESYIPTEDQPLALRTIQHAIETKGTFELEHRIFRSDGTIGWVYSRAVPILDDAGEISEWFGAASDVTERKKAEEDLRSSEAKHRSLIESMDDGFCVFEVIFDEHKKPVDYRFLDVNPAFEHHTGLANAKGRRMRELAPRHEAHWFETYGHVVLTGQPTRFENSAAQLQRWFEVFAWRHGHPQDRQVAAVFKDITERKRSEEHTRLIMGELNHRVKNTLATIDAIAQQTLHQSRNLDDFKKSFSPRLRSIAAAHGLLTRGRWKGSPLSDMLQAELKPRVATPEHLTLEGPPVVMPPRPALALHMAIHELATNAGKYGALSAPNGRICVSWDLAATSDEGQQLEIVWTELDGPPVEAPEKRSFGSKMITDVIEYELGGQVKKDWRREGLCCRIRVPMTTDDETPPAQDKAMPGSHATVSVAGQGRRSVEDEETSPARRVLLVEDNLALARLMSRALRDAGCEVEGPFGGLAAAQQSAAEAQFDAALLDVDLNGEKVYPVARQLEDRGIRFAFLTGFGVEDLTPEWRSYPVFAKPVDLDALGVWLRGST